MTALHWTAFNGRDDCLVAVANAAGPENNANVGANSASSDSTSAEACEQDFINARDAAGKTALHYACKRGASRKLRRKWLERHAVKYDTASSARLLLAMGASTAIADLSGGYCTLLSALLVRRA